MHYVISLIYECHTLHVDGKIGEMRVYGGYGAYGAYGGWWAGWGNQGGVVEVVQSKSTRPRPATRRRGEEHARSTLNVDHFITHTAQANKPAVKE